MGNTSLCENKGIRPKNRKHKGCGVLDTVLIHKGWPSRYNEICYLGDAAVLPESESTASGMDPGPLLCRSLCPLDSAGEVFGEGFPGLSRNANDNVV